VYCDIGGCLIIAADGAIWAESFVTGERCREEDQEKIRLAHIIAAERYDELRELKPSRPPAAKTCRMCDGRGRLTKQEVRCGQCLGLGWENPSPT
jgi:hypothetical protein